MTKEYLTIQEMAQESGLSEHTLRYYERIGLIAAIPRHDTSGHRRYPVEMAAHLENLACLRGTGMSIEDMRTYLALLGQGTDTVSLVQSRKLAKAILVLRSRQIFLEHFG
jgi:DNA-binding transcriptional MerR regulator